MFHPLITPLTTYMYTTDIQDNGTVSATDEERLPPGGFSLRHGFPEWFGRRSNRASNAQQQSLPQMQTPPRQARAPVSNMGTPSSRASAVGGSPGFAETRKRDISTFEVLRYIRRTFDEEDVLDSVPLEAAGNPGAWHAWRTHRRDNGKVFEDAPAGDAEKTSEEWNWEGVWEERVKKSIAASLSEPVLFGGAGGTDDVVSAFPRSSHPPPAQMSRLEGCVLTCRYFLKINFLNMEEGDVESVKSNLLRTLEGSPS